IRRVLKPGGLWILTTQGDYYRNKLSADERHRFEAGEVVCQRSAYRGLNLCQAFHPEPYIRDRFASGMRVVDFAREGARGNPKQDLYVLRRDPSPGLRRDRTASLSTAWKTPRLERHNGTALDAPLEA